MIRLFWITFAIASLTGCSYPGEKEVSGAMIYNLNCARCHNPRPPQEFSDREWDVIMPHMRERAHLTGVETDKVLQFIQLSNGVDAYPVAPRMSEQAQPATKKVEPTPAPRPRVVASPEDLKRGRALMDRYQCLGCHEVNGQGGVLGPALNGIVAKRGARFVRRKIKNPRINNPASAMPRFPLSDSEIRLIVQYMGSLK